MTPRISFFLLLNLLVSSQISYCQIVQPERFEIPLSKNEGLFDIVPAQEQGLFLYRQVIAKNTRLIELIKLDTSFTSQWKGYLAMEPKFELMGKRTRGKNLYLLLRHMEFSRKNLTMYVVNQDDGSFQTHLIRNFIPFMPTDFQVTEHGAIIGGYYSNVPVVVFYSFRNYSSKVIPGLLNEAGELTQINVTDDGAFTVLISAMTIKGVRTIWIKHYNAEGNILYQIPLSTDGNKHLLFGRSIDTGNDTQLIAGTYGKRKSEFSKGIFLASIDPGGYQQIKYYDYGDLENFFKYLKVKREQRIRDRIERRKIKGKKIRFNYRFIVHEIAPYKNGFVLLGEAFYPKYLSIDSRFNNSFFYSSTTPGAFMQNGRVFDGFRYTHAVVMGFDTEGRLLWDNSFEINDVKTFTLEQFVKLEMQPDKIALLYLFDNQIRSKIIEGDEVLEGKALEPIRTFSEGETAKQEKHANSKSRMDYWYRDYFYAYGVQQLVGPDREERRVFFVNKVSYANQPWKN